MQHLALDEKRQEQEAQERTRPALVCAEQRDPPEPAATTPLPGSSQELNSMFVSDFEKYKHTTVLIHF